MNIQAYYKNIDRYRLPVLGFDLYDRIKYINTTFEKTFQVSKQKLLNQNGAFFFGEDSFPYYVQPNIYKAGNGEIVNHFISLTVQDGLKQNMMVEYFPLYSEKKK
ncbi:MAG: PAS domain-containing protein [Bacteroidota bacterium]